MFPVSFPRQRVLVISMLFPLRSFALALALAAGLASASLPANAEALAQEVTVEAAIAFTEDVVQRFEEGDLAAIYAARPQSQLALMAEAAGTTPEGLIAAHVAKVERSLAMIEVAYAGLVPDSFDLRETSEGRAFVEGRIEEYWRIDALNMVRMIVPVLIFEEAGTLRLVALTKAGEGLLLRMAFPDFDGVEVAPAEMLPVWDNELPEALRAR